MAGAGTEFPNIAPICFLVMPAAFQGASLTLKPCNRHISSSHTVTRRPGNGPAASRRPQGRTGRRRSYGHACRLAGALRWRREGAGRREEEKANAILPLPARRARRQSTDVTQCEQARGNGPLFLLPSSSVRDLLLSLERKGEEGEAREIDIDMNHMIAIIGTYFFSKETSQTHTFSCNFPIPVELQAV